MHNHTIPLSSNSWESVGPFGVCYLSRAVVIVIVVTTDNVPARLKG